MINTLQSSVCTEPVIKTLPLVLSQLTLNKFSSSKLNVFTLTNHPRMHPTWRMYKGPQSTHQIFPGSRSWYYPLQWCKQNTTQELLIWWNPEMLQHWIVTSLSRPSWSLYASTQRLPIIIHHHSKLIYRPCSCVEHTHTMSNIFRCTPSCSVWSSWPHSWHWCINIVSMPLLSPTTSNTLQTNG